MDLSSSTLWWLLAGALIAAELATGTFYLLMLALGCAAGALAAHTGLGSTAQIVVGALVGMAATALWHLKRARQPRSAPAESNRDVNLDIGQTVIVRAWGEDGSAQVSYRGASWSAAFDGVGTPAPGPHAIVAVRGSQLVLAPAPPR
ncbi:MAG: NfeD family protein [Burkholderiales bacterium]|nr:NfeD family protein [Burkholderiales bacterium]